MSATGGEKPSRGTAGTERADEPGTAEERSAGGAELDEGLSDHQYFRAIEATFLRLRGSPLLLSPKDWRTAQEWHRQGIPLDLVERTLEELFAQRRERGTEGKVSSLRYCAPRVEAAWAALRELTAPGERKPEAEAEPVELGPRLAALAGSLPAELPGREELAGRIEALAPLGDPRAVEERLAEIEEEAIDALVAALRPRERRTLETQVDRTLAALAGRVPEAEAERTRDRLLRQRVRRKAGLPPLSLFADPIP